MNIPVLREHIESLCIAPCEPDEYGGSCWPSVVIDYSDVFENGMLGYLIEK